MTDFHRVGVSAKSHKLIESVSPKFLVRGLLQARKKTIVAMKDIQSELKEGMTEKDARVLANKVLKDYGVKAQWHVPYIRFGTGTSKTFRHLLQTNDRLKPNAPYYLDLGPAWNIDGIQYEGDYGDSFVFGTNKEYSKLIRKAHDMFRKAKKLWKTKKVSGREMYRYLGTLAKKEKVKLMKPVEGHRLSEFTHFKYSKKRLSEIPFYPSKNLWVLELQINDPKKNFGAFFEDILR